MGSKGGAHHSQHGASYRQKTEDGESKGAGERWGGGRGKNAPVVGIRPHRPQTLNDLHALGYPTKDGVLSVEERRRGEGDEKLGAVGVWAAGNERKEGGWVSLEIQDYQRFWTRCNEIARGAFFIQSLFPLSASSKATNDLLSGRPSPALDVPAACALDPPARRPSTTPTLLEHPLQSTPLREAPK